MTELHQIPNYQPGDIVVCYGKKSLFKYFIRRCIRFFTTEWWKNEPPTKVHHAEMIYGKDQYGEWQNITMEPPYYRITHLSKRVIVFRLKNKPDNFDKLFFDYVNEHLQNKTKYDYLKFIAFVGDWVFRTNWFTLHIRWNGRDICSESVARYYEERVKRVCSYKPADSTAPDDILDYCKLYDIDYDIIYDDEEPLKYTKTEE